MFGKSSAAFMAAAAFVTSSQSAEPRLPAVPPLPAMIAQPRAESAPSAAPVPASPSRAPTSTPACRTRGDIYRDPRCLEPWLGRNFISRLMNYYALEWSRASAPDDPAAPPARRAGWPAQPQSVPPMPFTEWPYGGATAIGVTRPSSVDSPLMVALGDELIGRALDAAHTQIYGWVNAGGNLSTSARKPGGNWPAAYDYTPNTAQLDQAVLYLERLPDTVQQEHVDWGFRISAIYGVDYRYTTAFGLSSYQLLKRNRRMGYDFPMVYGELYVPQIAQGLLLRVGRFISIPDIEAQLAPNNYMYSHSMTYSFDNYTNTGVQASLALSKNWFVQAGLTVGSDTMPWNVGAKVANPFPNPVFPGARMKKDPGAGPSFSLGLRWQSDSGDDAIYVVADALNNGTWGYNNLQWKGATWYHRFGPHWHISTEAYELEQRKVLNASDPAGIITHGGYPFTPANGFRFNAPNFAQCHEPAALTCTARVWTALSYLNYSPEPLDNFSLRTEFYDDQEGQRTGARTRYIEVGIGLQHWLSPQIELRPEVSYYNALDAKAFNGNFNQGIAPNRKQQIVAAMDAMLHF